MGTTEDRLRHEADLQRNRMGDTLEAIGDRISPERMVERRKAAVGQRFRHMKDAVMGSPDFIEPATHRMREKSHDAVQAVQHSPEYIAETTRGNPLAAGIVAFGAGLLFASMMPGSRAEQRLVQDAAPQLQQATEQLKETGRQVASDAKQHVQEATEQLKETGSDAASSVRDQAKSSVEEMKS